MDHRFDTVSKAMATGTTRREALKWLSGMLGGMLVGTPLIAYGKKPSGGGGGPPTCKGYCNMAARTAADRAQCLQACEDCNGDTSKLCGPRGAIVCCSGQYECCVNNVCYNGYDSHGHCGATCASLVACASSEICLNTTCQYSTALFCGCEFAGGTDCNPAAQGCPSAAAALAECQTWCQAHGFGNSTGDYQCSIC